VRRGGKEEDVTESADELVELEERGWRALATEGAGGPFYAEVLDREVLMLLPGGLVIADRDAALGAMSGPPWSEYRIEAPVARLLTPDAGFVAYGVRARRGDAPEYSALVSSAYVRRDGSWRLAFHQQTPR
jgi:hypothetical protein